MGCYDYSKPNNYFVTICTNRRKCIFGDPGDLNCYGEIARQSICEIERHFPNVKIDKFAVMPNHIHMIVALQANDTALPVVIGQYKAFVTKQIRAIEPGVKVWQTSFHDHVIRNQTGYSKIWNYIDGNPGKWQEDCFYSG